MKKTLSYIILSFVTLALAAQTPADLRSTLETQLIDAVTDIAAENIGAALPKLESIVKADSTFDAARYYLGLCEYSAERFDDALDNFKAAASLDSLNMTYLDALAMMYVGMNRRDSLVSVYKTQIRLRPERYKTPRAMTLIGDDYLANGQDSLAEESYQEALSLDSDYAPAMASLSQFYGMKGNMPALFSVLSKFSSNPEIACAPKCEFLEDMFSRFNPKVYQIWKNQLDTLVQNCLETHPMDTSALKFAGAWYYGTGREDRGLEYYDQWLELCPDSPGPHFVKMSLLIANKEWDSVIEEADRMAVLFRDDLETLVSVLCTKGDAYSAKKQRSKAFKCYEQALSIDPENIMTLNNYAYYLSLAGRKLDKAAQMSYKTIQKEPDNATYLDTYGWILYMQKKPAEAKPYFKRAIIYGGKKSPVILEHYSKVLEALGEKDLAEYYRNLSTAPAR